MGEAEGSSYTIKLTDARIVATVEDGGGAIVEQGLTLNLTEGRAWRHYSDDDAAPVMAYEFEFALADGPAPDAAEQIAARVVIEGVDPQGKRLEIRGDGWIGYDDHGNVEGHFEDPPTILAGDSRAERHRSGTWPDDVRAKLSEQYLAAARGRDLRKYEAEET